MDRTMDPPRRNESKTLPSTLSAERAERLGWIFEQLQACAVAKGQEFTEARLRLNAEDLIDVAKDKLEAAFRLVRQELDFVPQVSEIRRMAGADKAFELDKEARAAWDVLIKFVGRWCDFNSEYTRAYVMEGAPKLPARIRDTVRRTGGWIAYLGMKAADYPFQQKRFFEEYAAWVEVEHKLIDMSKVLPAATTLRLQAMPQAYEPTEEAIQKGKEIIARVTSANQAEKQPARGSRAPGIQLTKEQLAELANPTTAEGKARLARERAEVAEAIQAEKDAEESLVVARFEA